MTTSKSQKVIQCRFTDHGISTKISDKLWANNEQRETFPALREHVGCYSRQAIKEWRANAVVGIVQAIIVLVSRVLYQIYIFEA